MLWQRPPLALVLPLALLVLTSKALADGEAPVQAPMGKRQPKGSQAKAGTKPDSGAKKPKPEAKTPRPEAKKPKPGAKAPKPDAAKKPEISKGKPGPGKSAVKGRKLMAGTEVMRLRALRSLPQDERAELDIRVEEKGRISDKRRRLVRSILRKDGLERSLLRFHAPPTVRGLAVLTIEKRDGDDDQWIYDPGLRKPKRTTRSQVTESFAGTGFTFEDLRAEDLAAHEYRTVALKTVQARPAWIVEVKPRPGKIRALRGYSRRRLSIDSERYVTLRIDFYDARGKLIKYQENTRWKAIGGVYRPYRVRMKELSRDRTTYIRFRSWVANEGIAGSLFTTRELSRPPR